MIKPAPVKGLHAIIEHSGEISRYDCEKLELLLSSAAKAAGATILGANFHSFGEAMGNTGVLILAESHISVHTWPEHNYAAIDIFFCGNLDRDGLEPIETAIQVLRSADKNGCFHSQIISRSAPEFKANIDGDQSDTKIVSQEDSVKRKSQSTAIL